LRVVQARHSGREGRHLKTVTALLTLS
jgi:hypothetical protein